MGLVKIRWAVLLARIYDVLPLLCPACGGELRILAFLTDPPVVSAIMPSPGLCRVA
jgi:C4-type Zn-finger protein